MQSTILKKAVTVPSFYAEIEKNGAENDGVKVRQWTQKEYYQMAELGFFLGKRVELIEGEIVEISPMNKSHATAVRF